MLGTAIPPFLLLIASAHASPLIQPQNGSQFQNVTLKAVSNNDAQSEMLPSITITSVYNETLGSLYHPFACWEYPDFTSNQAKKWKLGTKHQFELDCWTTPILQTQLSRPSRKFGDFALVALDNFIYWFSAPQENCWFPDYVVQKDALYGPSTSQLGGAIDAAPARSGGIPWPNSVPSSGLALPPWFRGSGGFTGWSVPGASVWGNSPKPEDDLRNKIRYCPTPTHQVGIFRAAYAGSTYCYSCTRLDCDNRRIDLPSPETKSTLTCWTRGDLVDQDAIWWKLKATDDCYIPNQVFDPNMFMGNAGECPTRV